MSYDVLVFSENLSDLGSHIGEQFSADRMSSMDAIREQITTKKYRAFVCDTINQTPLDLSGAWKELLDEGVFSGVPFILLTEVISAEIMQTAFDIGCDDLIDNATSKEEACTRITKSIFNHIAASQLNQRLVQATETARNAMVDNSDLGANIQFLLKVHNSDNLDQLGQQFFSTIQRYGLFCSLQMRTQMGVKNMEANGMAKDLESKLLSQLKGGGRYVDFGRRSITNFDRVSLLIKNMPVNDAEKYGTIKDNTFFLVQGINSRILALEDRHKLQEEKASLHKLSSDVNDVIGALKKSYQEVMRKIVNEVENASESIHLKIPSLALMEQDEEFIERVTQDLLLATNRVFNDGLRVDELFGQLESAVQRSLASAQSPSEVSDSERELDNLGGDVELF